MKVKSRKFKADLIRHDAIKYQVSIRGRGAINLTKDMANTLVLRELNHDTTMNFEVRIKVWRGGAELDWRDDNPRAEVLRANLRRALQAGRIAFRKVG